MKEKLGVFSCRFAEEIRAFIEQKRMVGYPYDSSARILAVFDDFVSTNFPDALTLTKEMCLKWATLKPGECGNGLLRRVTPIRQLGKYMQGCGKDAFILPGLIPSKPVKYIPHIYTETEIHAFFSALDKGGRNFVDSARNIIAPIFFRLLYCCGLRSSEARLLATSDVDLQTGRLFIRESKGWESRSIFMSESLRLVCIRYDRQINELRPARAAFFPNAEGGFLPKGIQVTWFHYYWDKLPESKLVSGSCRVHDLRHSFAVNTLNRWVREGKNLNALYPYLSEYLGHRNYADTDYYLHLVSEFYPDIEEKLQEVNREILPEVAYETE
jgi:integrase/recombinase XerD